MLVIMHPDTAAKKDEAFMLTLYRRHKPTCPHFAEGRKFHHCKCMIWADGVLGGREIRRSMRTRDRAPANREIQKWEAAERMSECGGPVFLSRFRATWKSSLRPMLLERGSMIR